MTDLTPDQAEAVTGSIPPLSQGYTRTDMHRDFAAVLGTEQGRRVLGHLLALCGMYAPAPLEPGMSAAESVMFNEGRRTLGLQINQHLRTPDNGDEKVTYGGRKR